MRRDLYEEMYQQENYYWWHQAKRRLVKQFLPRHKKMTVLDIGCGTGKLIEDLQPHGEIWGIDSSPQAINYCRRRHLRHIYKEHFPHVNRVYPRFDVITCLDVLEHIADDSQALKTVYKLLKPNGLLILTVPAYTWLFSYWDKMLGHYRRYHRSSLENIVIGAGFRVKKISYFHSFLVPIVLPFRLIRGLIFKTQKPQSDFVAMPPMVHHFFTSLSKVEQSLLKYSNIPFGLSLLCIAQKPLS